MLDDGTYDAIIVDAVVAREERVDAMVLELVIVHGARKGDVVSIRARELHRDALDVLGLPATIVVRDGEPRVQLDA